MLPERITLPTDILNIVSLPLFVTCVFSPSDDFLHKIAQVLY
jgi:hypothetical protein